MDSLELSTFLNEKVKNKGLTLKKLSDMSGIPVGHLQNLTSGALHQLPPAPYVRGYLKVLGPILNFDDQAAWEHFKAIQSITSAGVRDELPRNRYARRATPRSTILIVLLLIIVAYVGFRFTKIFGTPIVRIDNPSEILASVADATFVARGNLQNGDTIFVNGESVPLSETGDWEKRILLQEGLNSIQVTAKKFLGGEVQIIRQVMYEPLPVQLLPPLTTSTVPATPTQ